MSVIIIIIITIGSDSAVDPYLVTTLPGTQSPLTSPSSATPPPSIPPDKSFSPIPPPSILRHSDSDNVYYSTVPADDDVRSKIREPSPYEESVSTEEGVASGGVGVVSGEEEEEEEEEEEDPIMEDLLTSTTNVVKSVVELSTKLYTARPNDYVELVKVRLLLLLLLFSMLGCGCGFERNVS